MREQGVVTRLIPPDAVEVAMGASEACRQCKACHRDQEGRVNIEALGVSGVKPGDGVELEISSGGVVAAGFVVYLLPVVSLIAGYLVGAAFGGFLSRMSEETAGIAGAICLLALSFGAIRLYDRRVRSKGRPRARVIRIIPEGKERSNIDAVSD